VGVRQFSFGSNTVRVIHLFIIVFAMVVLSLPAYSQTKVSLSLRHATFEEFLNAIKQQTNYRFVYSPGNLPNKQIKIKVKEQEALSILDKQFTGTDYTYTLLADNLIAISLRNLNTTKITISGIITNREGLAMQGVSITLPGSKNGTVTDEKGQFSINSNPGQKLSISYIGYKSQIIVLQQSTGHLAIVMEQNLNQLNEIVVTALNIGKEDRKIGYAVSTINGDDITRAREANMIMDLEGKVAGLNISGVYGGPSSSSRILLRGATSMNAGSPLVILNGVPIDNTQRGSANEYGGADYGDGISNLNPDDIDKLTVLKGSAASALYGARAANGVIIVTTKTAKKNSRIAVEYNMNLSYDKAVNSTDFQYVYGQGMQNKRPNDLENAIASSLSSWGEKLDGQPSVQLNGTTQPYVAVKDNVQQFYRAGPSFTNTVAVSGGNDRGVFRLSASNISYESVLPNSGLNRKTINLNTGYDITPRLNLSFYGNYVYELGKNRSYLSDGPMNANYGIEFLATSAQQALLKPGFDPQTGVETSWNSDEYKTNPYFVINKQVDNSTRNRFITSTVARYKLADRTYLQARFGYDVSNDNLLNVLPTGTAFTINQQGTLNDKIYSQTYELNTDLLFTTNRNITKDLSFDFSAGGNFRKRYQDQLVYSGSQFIIPYVYEISNLASITSTHNIYQLVTESAYYTADLNFKRYLNLSITGRDDVYSTLPSNNRNIFVPGISGSFIFSDLIHLPAVEYGKLRMSFAKTSGEPGQPYTTQTYFTPGDPINKTPTGDFGRDLPNYNLKPFTLNEFETGINLMFLNNRLGIDATYFHRVTNDEITNAAQSVTTGFTSAYVNLGKTLNKGTELVLTALPVKSRNFSWNITLNYTHIKNTLLSIDGSSTYVLTGTYRPLNANTAMVTGKSITQIMAYDYKRNAQGQIIIDNNGIPERGDLKPMGGTLPTDFGGITNTFRYRNFSLSFLVDFKLGNKILSATENYSYTYGLNKATLVGRETGVVAQGVHEDGSPNTINVPAYNYYPQLASNISELSVINGSFIKFRQLTLGYTIIPHSEKERFIQSIAIDLVGRNLFTLLKYSKNIDPESEFSPNLAYAGIEGASLPSVRTLGVNLNIKFR
jgi:TonB-linked SusC/RagA family outer membrane protein